MKPAQTKGWQHFLTLCLAAKDEQRLAQLFDLFLTVDERESIATRCLLIEALLKNEQTQREIAASLNISIAKITRGSNELKHTPEELKAFLVNANFHS